MWLTNSSIGRKLIMSLSGAFLILFVTFHVLMNAVALISPSAYNVICAFLGANWYALVGTAVLAGGFLLHILYATWLTLQNRKARGNSRYAVTSTPKQVAWASKNMLVLGIVVVAFLVVHMIQFWSKMQLIEVLGEHSYDYNGLAVSPAAGTYFLEMAFGEVWTLPVYIIGFVALWFHMTHGFWSMFQTTGWNNDTWLPRLKTIGNWWVTIVIGLFIVQAVVFTIKANNKDFSNCEELQKQNIELLGKHAEAPCATPCADSACTETCPESTNE